MDGWMGGWVGGWMDGWMDGWMEQAFVAFCIVVLDRSLFFTKLTNKY